MKTKLVFVIQAFELQTPDGGLSDVVVCEVYAKDEAEAMAKVKKLVVKKFYRLARVIEQEDK